MNFKDFKKVKEDKSCAMLRHKDGHELKIAKRALSSDKKNALSKLPLYAADGADTMDDSDVEDAPKPAAQPPVSININAQPQQQAQPGLAPVPAAPQGLATPQAAPQPQAPAADAAIQQAQPDQSAQEEQSAVAPAPQAPPAAPIQQASPPPNSPAGVKQGLTAEDAAWQHDLSNGHVTPETYSSLFAKKDTLGKIGTVFGMLLSGAGSGLSHQPNALMQIMDNEIKNDLNAQIQSKNNANTFIGLNQQHQVQLAQISKMGQEGKGVEANTAATEAGTARANEMQPFLIGKAAQETEGLKAQTEATKVRTGIEKSKLPGELQKTASETGVNQAQAASLTAEAKAKSYALANMQMNRAALHTLTQQVSKLPVGSPQRVQAEQTLAMLAGQVNSENYGIADRAAAQSALLNYAGGANGGNDQEQNFKNQNKMLRLSGNDKLAQDSEQKHFPGIEGQASVPLGADDRAQINSGITFQNQLDRFIDWTKKHSGDLNPKDRNEGEALAGSLQGAFRLATHGGVYKEGEQGFISNIIDSTPTKFFNKVRVLPQLQAVKKDSAAQLDQLVKSKGFKGYQGASNGGESPQYKVVKGVKYMRGPNGEAVKVK